MAVIVFLITHGLPASLQKQLEAQGITCLHAQLIGIRPTQSAQINYCYSYNMVMLTNDKK